MNKHDYELLEKAINRGKIDLGYIRRQHAKKPLIIGVDIPHVSAIHKALLPFMGLRCKSLAHSD